MSDYKPLTCLPVLPLRGIVVFPGCVTHFDVGRSRSARAVEEAMRADQMIFLVTQRDVQCDEPKKTDLYPIGTVAYVRQILRLPGDNMRILVEGKYRAQLTDMIHTEPYLFARAMELDEPDYHAAVPRTQALVRQAHQLFEQFVDLAVKSGQENLLQGSATDNAGELADFIAQNATFGYEDKQRILETLPPVHRLELCIRMMAKELDILRLESEINDQVQQNVNQNQRDYYLREQLHVIREELGEDDDSDADSYRTKIKALKLPEETEEKLLREVARFARQQPGSAEASVLRNYLDTVLELPWNKETKERLDVKAAAKILDEDHFGLETVKKRILETLAVRQLAPELPGQILCLVGPPGVGKTSVAISIARALNRKLARLSLGGVRDEAEIRGHRKTYIGAMPGRIMTALIQAKSKNALLLLDEIDKLGSDYKGDPSSALLEVLDSAQNSSFRDHYIEVPFDLSHCMFITTANTTDTIPRALLDRMEVIELGSYTDEEKLQIAKRHLLPKQLKKHGIKRTQVRVSDDAIREIIACYTRESGVRSLERQIAALCRKCAMRFVSDEPPKRISITVNKQNLTHDMILKTGVFNLSVLSQDASFAQFQQYGFRSGRDTADKFDGAEPVRTANGLRYEPAGTNAVLSGKVIQTLDCGTHTLFLAEVTEARVLSDVPSATYAYYFEHIKPKPQPAAEKKTGFVCKICGYVYEGETLPADYICPLCKHGAEDFEPLK